MSNSQAEIESVLIDLSADAFDAFCEDISGMFGTEMKCQQLDACPETIKGLKKRFEKLTAVNCVKSEGELDGTFHLIFDQAGLFILSGVIAMMPEKKVLEKIKKGSIDDVESMNDSVKECGNLLVGSWDRVFRDGLEKHGRLTQSNVFVGKPWYKPKETISLSNKEEVIFLPFEMTIEPYPTFECGVIFPKSFFGPAVTDEPEKTEPKVEEKAKENPEEKQPEAQKPEPKTEETDTDESDITAESKEEKPEEKQPEAQKPELKTEETDTDESDITAESKEEKPEEKQPEAQKPELKTEETDTDESDTTTDTKEEKPQAQHTGAEKENPRQKQYPEKLAKVEKTDSSDHSAEEKPETKKEPEQAQDANEKSESDSVGAPPAQQPDSDSKEQKTPEQKTEVKAESVGGSVSETIQNMTRSSAVLPGESLSEAITEDQVFGSLPLTLQISAKDVMQENVVWANPEDSVQQAIAAMQQKGTGYIIVGLDEKIEGIVSKSDLTAALSPYLRPIFSKWHRPLDDATLQIKIKWIMSRPVNTIKPDAPLASILENMCRLGQRAMPVIDDKGKVLGLVTAFDIFKLLLNNNSDISPVGQTLQAPALEQN